MNIFTDPSLYKPRKPSVVTVGNFDGVHKGHSALIAEVIRRAKQRDATSVLVTFEPHTRMVVGDDTRTPLLSTFDEKAFLIERCGVENLVCVPFTDDIRRLSAAEFIFRILKTRIGAVEWVMGKGHTFGSDRVVGNDSLRELMDKYDIYMFTFGLSAFEELVVSSTEIRASIAAGDIGRAVGMLGHPYVIRARRVAGKKIGTALGFPTLNFEKPHADKILPPAGVYAAELCYEGKKHKGTLYFGDCPTFTHRDVHFEFHLFSVPEKLPETGDHAVLMVEEFIRRDRAFDSTEGLVEQIKRDIENINHFFSGV